MKPSKTDNEPQLFQSSLEAIINLDHPLAQLAEAVDWDYLDGKLSTCYAADMAMQRV